MDKHSPSLFGSVRVIDVLGVLLGGGLIAIAFRDQVTDIVSRAVSGVDFGYVFLSPMVAVYLMLLRRTRIRNLGASPGGWFGIALVVVSFICSSIGEDRSILVLWHAAPLVAMAGLMLAFLGLKRWLALAPGIFVLFAGLPLPGAVRLLVARPLQDFATSVTALVLGLAGVDVQRIGNLIEINGVLVAVGEACNGMRLVLPLAIVIYAFVFSLPLRPRIRLLLVAMSVPVAVACNILRLVPTSLAYGFLEEWASAIHDVGGWAMIPLAIFMMLGILRALEWLEVPVARLRLAVS